MLVFTKHSIFYILVNNVTDPLTNSQGRGLGGGGLTRTFAGSLSLLFCELVEYDGLSLVRSFILEVLVGLVSDGVVEIEAGHGNSFLLLTVRELAGKRKRGRERESGK